MPLLWVAVFAQALTCREATPADLDLLLFGSLEGGAGTFISSGAKVGWGSLSTSGPLALISAGAGMRVERITCGCGEKHTFIHQVGTHAALLGYQWILPEGAVAVFAGVETTLDRLGALAPEIRTGLHLQAEAWLRPTETTLVQATVTAGSARNDAWARLAWGYRLGDGYLGPEGSATVEESGYQKFAAGLHATDYALADIRFRVSAGMQWETGSRAPAPYLTLSAWAPW